VVNTMQTLFQSVVSLQARLRERGTLSAVIGGIAVAVWGDPRVPRDVDVKELLRRDMAPRLLEAIGPDCVPLQPDPLAVLTRSGVLFVHDVYGLGGHLPLLARQVVLTG
jgi:hypothetical protein